MTPTLSGRWQTRFWLMSVFGVPITAAFGQIYGDMTTVFFLLGYALLFGFIWDIPYSYIQTLRWNRDWPPLFAFYAGLLEGSILYLLTQITIRLPFYRSETLLYGIPSGITFDRFWLHYGTVFLVTFIASLGLLHILMPRWRYRGGQWMSSWS